MKKTVFGVVLCLSLAIFGFSGGFSIKLNGGANCLMGGDYNKQIQGRNDYWNSLPGFSIDGELTTLSLGWNFGSEFIYHFTDRMGLGLGVGYLAASSDSTLSMSLGLANESINFKPSVSVIPITLNFHYFLPVSDLLRLSFTVGPGLYISSFNLEEYGQISLAGLLLIDSLVKFEPESILAFGFQGGLGLEFDLSPNVALCLDILGRLAAFSGLTGPATNTGTILGIPYSISMTGTFYYYEEDGFASAVIDNTMPSGSGITNAREASVGLSGVVAQIGVKIHI